MTDQFRTTVGSEPDCEELVGDLYFNDQIVCVLTQEEGLEAMTMTFHGPAVGKPWKFRLQDFEEALAALKKRMWDLRRNQDSTISIVYVRLLDEGTLAYRPTEAVYMASGTAQLAAPGDYDSEDEHWEFPPGSVVRIETQVLQGKKVSVAVAIAG